MSLKNKADEYFSQINCMAARMCADMNETKSSYEELWSTLSPDEQEQILSESIIKTEIMIKYGKTLVDSSPEEYGTKLVVDDTYSYRDEHSAPFSFRTKSQRDLTIFKSLKPKDVPKTQAKKDKQKKTVPNEFPAVIDTSTAQFLPKTGLDLLDNW